MTAYTIDLTPVIELSDKDFEQLCTANPEIKFERTPQGELVIMPPTGGETGSNNAELIADFIIWNRQTKLGKVFDSSTCFRLKAFGAGDGRRPAFHSQRSPDVYWIEKSRWEALSAEDRQKFPPIAPDFVLELLSPTDSLSATREKMEEYLTAGVCLGWLINPKDKTVEIYRQGHSPEILEQPTAIAEESVLPGFSLSLDWLWNT